MSTFDNLVIPQPISVVGLF